MRTHTLIFGSALAALSLATSLSSAQPRRDNGGLFVVGEAARLEAGRDVEVAIVIGDDLVVAGHVKGVAAAIGGDLHVLAGAQIDGPALAIGGALHIDDAAKVAGPHVLVAPGDFSQVAEDLGNVDFQREAPSFGAGSAMRLAQVFSLFVVGLILVLLAPRHVQGVRQTLMQQSGVAVLVGTLVMIGLVPLCVLLAVSLVGIPLIPVAIIAVVAACTLGLVALAATLGYWTRFIKDPDNLLGAMSIGLTIIAFAVALPFLGAVVMFFASAWGAGAALLSRFGARPPAPRTPPAQSEHAPSAQPHAPVAAES
jgi:hypothetical protein